MTQPLRAYQDPGGDRYYVGLNNEDRYLSVTSALSVLPKPWLSPWVAKVTAEIAMELFDYIIDYDADLHDWDFEKLAKGLAKMYEEERDSAGDFGTKVHEAAEQLLKVSRGSADIYHALLREMELDDEVGERLLLLGQWLQEHFVEIHAVEATLYNDWYKYAGTADIMATVDGLPYIIDIKTSKMFDMKWAYQLAAYAQGEYIMNEYGNRVEREFEEYDTAVMWLGEKKAQFVKFPNWSGSFKIFHDCLILKRDLAVSSKSLGRKDVIWEAGVDDAGL
jgi:hypothetical protein